MRIYRARFSCQKLWKRLLDPKRANVHLLPFRFGKEAKFSRPNCGGRCFLWSRAETTRFVLLAQTMPSLGAISSRGASTYANIDTDECVLVSRRLVKSSNNYRTGRVKCSPREYPGYPFVSSSSSILPESSSFFGISHLVPLLLFSFFRIIWL